MTLETIDSESAQQLIGGGALLIDIRDADEHARVRIEAALNVPMAKLCADNLPDAPIIIFHCKSGQRTATHAARLRSAASGKAYLLKDGIDGWRRAGLALVEDRGQPIEIMRQVQIVAGGLVLIGTGLGLLVAPGFFAVAGLVGAGLTFAGVSGWCGMAQLLAIMPWNLRTAGR